MPAAGIADALATGGSETGGVQRRTVSHACRDMVGTIADHFLNLSRRNSSDGVPWKVLSLTGKGPTTYTQNVFLTGVSASFYRSIILKRNNEPQPPL